MRTGGPCERIGILHQARGRFAEYIRLMFLGFDRKGDQRCWFQRVLFGDHSQPHFGRKLNEKSSFLAPR